MRLKEAFQNRLSQEQSLDVEHVRDNAGGDHKEPGGAGLGNTAKYVDRSAAQERRKILYFLQRSAAKLLPNERVNQCRWSVQRLDRPVEVHLHTEGFASYSGLQTCGSVWSCPVCSKRISEVRRTELNDLLAWAREHDFKPVLLTLTARHSREDALDDQLSKLKAAKQRFRQRKEWRRLVGSCPGKKKCKDCSPGEIKKSIIGSVTATEVTYGKSSGWHTHFHELVIVDAKTEQAAVQMIGGLGRVWISALRSQGLDGIQERAFQVQGASAAGNYIGKWGAAEEVALSGQKKGRKGGRAPAQLLLDGAMTGDVHAAELWREFAIAFKGTRQLVWSNGLKQLAGIDEESDDEIGGDDEVDPGQGDAQLVGLIDHQTWTGDASFVGAKYRRVKILDAAETGGADAVFSQVNRQEYDDDPALVEAIKPEGHGVEGIAPAHQVTLEGPAKWEDTKSPYEQRDFSALPGPESPHLSFGFERWQS